jgi:hypothetical protein
MIYRGKGQSKPRIYTILYSRGAGQLESRVVERKGSLKVEMIMKGGRGDGNLFVVKG